jgi:hypothetical protein
MQRRAVRVPSTATPSIEALVDAEAAGAALHAAVDRFKSDGHSRG